MSTSFRAKLDLVLSGSSAPKELIVKDRQAILRAGIDSEEKLLRAAFSGSAAATTLAVVGWLLPRWPQAARNLPYFQATKALLSHRSPMVRAEAAVALGLFRIRGAAQALVSSLNDSSIDVRVRAIASLGIHGDAATLPALMRLLSDRRQPVSVRSSVADALGGFDAERVDAAVNAALSDPSPQVRASAAHSVGELRLWSAAPALRTLSRPSERPVVRDAALGALARLTEERNASGRTSRP